jgi:L-iditol 2-dehydrogenase
MRAAVKTPGGRFRLEDRPTPRLQGADWALVEVAVAGICGTDLRHWEKPEESLVGRIMGHELAGTVVEVGPEVHHVAPGQRVVVETVVGDGTCRWCRVGQYHVCPNLYEVRGQSWSQAFAEYVAGPASRLHPLPDGVAFEEAALLDTFAVSLHGVHLGVPRPDERVAIIGAGPIGLAALQLSRLAGAEVLVSDVLPHALDAAADLGAAVVVNAEHEDLGAAVAALTDGQGVDLAVECAGGPGIATTIADAVAATRIKGRVVIIGGFDSGRIPVELEWADLQQREVRLLPSASYSTWDGRSELRTCLDLLAAGRVDAASLVTHRYSLEQINAAFEVAQDRARTKATFVAIHMR